MPEHDGSMTGPEWKAANDMTELNKILKEIADAQPEDPRKNVSPRDAHDGYPLSPRDITLMYLLGVCILLAATLAIGTALTLIIRTLS